MNGQLHTASTLLLEIAFLNIAPGVSFDQPPRCAGSLAPTV
jgi:hypothetical protein